MKSQTPTTIHTLKGDSTRRCTGSPLTTHPTVDVFEPS
uniref:Uncharacterized protein n=1 Tax=Arundo donax TaxID=35708 RepID=A0A0A9BNS0_ARUDO